MPIGEAAEHAREEDHHDRQLAQCLDGALDHSHPQTECSHECPQLPRGTSHSSDIQGGGAYGDSTRPSSYAVSAADWESPIRSLQEKGSRDALAYLVLSIISAFEERQKVVLFCSDVQGAFDRVSEERFAYKVARAGLPVALIPVFIS